jgi:hypothetical protein
MQAKDLPRSPRLPLKRLTGSTSLSDRRAPAADDNIPFKPRLRRPFRVDEAELLDTGLVGDDHDLDEAEHDVLAYITFAPQHRTKLHSTNPLERLNKEVKRRADVVGIFPNEESIVRLVGAVLIEQNDDWPTQNR